MSVAAQARASVVTAPGTLELQALHVPRELHGGALIAVEAAAVCGTDVGHYHDERFLSRGPLVLGHENVGRVLAVAPEAEDDWDVAVGDRVVVDELLPCGRCNACRHGAQHRCPRTDFREPDARRYGRTPLSVWPGLWGGFAEVLYLHPRAACYRVPDRVDAAAATFAHPLANGLRWLGDVAALRPGERVLVLGPGAHGLGCVLAARTLGAGRVSAAGLATDSTRLADAVALGADATVAIDDRDDPRREVLELTGTDEVDVVVDLTPNDVEVVTTALEVLAPGGRLLLAGHKGSRLASVHVDTVLRKELTVVGVRGSDPAALRSAVDLVDRHRHVVLGLSTAAFDLDGVDVALRVMADRDTPAPAHVVVIPA